MINNELQKFIENSSSFRENAELKNINWFRVGGPAKLMFRPKNEDELQEFLKIKNNLEIFVMGVGSNIIIRDGGFNGCIIRLGKGFANINQLNKDTLEIGTANLDLNIALYAKELEIEGLEFLSGIPGGIGGAIKMNAGAYGTEISDILLEASGFDYNGNYITYSNKELKFSYRRSNPPKDIIFTKAIFKGKKGNRSKIEKKIKEIKTRREATQPIREKTGGSTFTNPKGDKKAWQLIDQAGLRGKKIGKAKMSNQHCNFMINTGDCSAIDLEKLGNKVKQLIFEETGIKLEWEIKIIGDKKDINVNTNQANVNTNQANVNTNQANVNTNQANVNTNQANVNTKSNSSIRIEFILTQLQKNKKIKAKEVREKFNVSKTIIWRDFQKLIKNNKIIKKGGGNNVWYEKIK